VVVVLAAERKGKDRKGRDRTGKERRSRLKFNFGGDDWIVVWEVCDEDDDDDGDGERRGD